MNASIVNWTSVLVTTLKTWILIGGSTSNRIIILSAFVYILFLGGLLICLPREQAAKYCAEIKKIEGHQAWIIGIVEGGKTWQLSRKKKRYIKSRHKLLLISGDRTNAAPGIAIYSRQ